MRKKTLEVIINQTSVRYCYHHITDLMVTYIPTFEVLFLAKPYFSLAENYSIYSCSRHSCPLCLLYPVLSSPEVNTSCWQKVRGRRPILSTFMYCRLSRETSSGMGALVCESLMTARFKPRNKKQHTNTHILAYNICTMHNYWNFRLPLHKTKFNSNYISLKAISHTCHVLILAIC